METALKTSSFGSATTYQEPKRLSKLGVWMQNNPGGIAIVMDRRAVNK